MLHRIRRVRDAVYGRLSSDDWQWVAENLTELELNLFCRLDRADQYHSIQVARTTARLAAKIKGQPRKESIDLSLAIKAGLLHDIGKIDLKLSLFERMLPVIVTWISPAVSCRLGSNARFTGRLRCFSVYWHHAKWGGKLGRDNQLDEQIVEVITKHQEPVKPDDSQLIILIKTADSLH